MRAMGIVVLLLINLNAVPASAWHWEKANRGDCEKSIER
jgi:hypothetical protein